MVVSSDAHELLAGWDGDAPREDTWQPARDVDLSDGRGLHELLYHEGDLRRPRAWCAAPTQVLVERALEALEARLVELSPGDTIRILDYGTGTGLAAIELLKACRGRGLEERLEGSGVSLELHLVDIPTSWFAQGFEVLGECAWTRFHTLTDDDGRFRALSDVIGGGSIDVVLASMVGDPGRPDDPLDVWRLPRHGPTAGSLGVVDVCGGARHHALGHLGLELLEASILLGRGVLLARQIDELLGHVAFAQDERHASIAVAQLEDEPLACAAVGRPGQRGVDDVAIAGDRTGDELEAVARTRSTERGPQRHLPALHWALRV